MGRFLPGLGASRRRYAFCFGKLFSIRLAWRRTRLWRSWPCCCQHALFTSHRYRRRLGWRSPHYGLTRVSHPALVSSAFLNRVVWSFTITHRRTHPISGHLYINHKHQHSSSHHSTRSTFAFTGHAFRTLSVYAGCYRGLSCCISALFVIGSIQSSGHLLHVPC